jgi:nucleotide-binding universal stress UspA family protein
MPDQIIVCTDGSPDAVAAAAAGLAVVGAPKQAVIVTVIEPPDDSLVTGGGFAGGVMSEEELDRDTAAAHSTARSVLEDTASQLELPDAELKVLEGTPGQAVCQFASDLNARAIVMGSRGRGVVKRAVLGSVSDHVVRHAPCPVVISGPAA